jgi:phosphotransferase system IIB component
MMIILDEMKDDFNAFLKNNALWMVLVLVGIIAIVVALILIFGLKNKNKKPQPQIAEKSKWVEALGGSDNIVSSEAYGSRLAVVLNDKSKMDKEALKGLGVTNFIEMSNKVTLLLEDKAELVKAELDK